MPFRVGGPVKGYFWTGGARTARQGGCVVGKGGCVVGIFWSIDRAVVGEIITRNQRPLVGLCVVCSLGWGSEDGVDWAPVRHTRRGRWGDVTNRSCGGWGDERQRNLRCVRACVGAPHPLLYLATPLLVFTVVPHLGAPRQGWMCSHRRARYHSLPHVQQ